jgi:hypothetical protein
MIFYSVNGPNGEKIAGSIGYTRNEAVQSFLSAMHPTTFSRFLKGSPTLVGPGAEQAWAKYAHRGFTVTRWVSNPLEFVEATVLSPDAPTSPPQSPEGTNVENEDERRAEEN